MRLMYQRLGGTQAPLLLIPAIIAYALWDHLNQIVVAGWVLITCIVYSARIMLMNKPIPPARLRAFMRTVRRNQTIEY